MVYLFSSRYRTKVLWRFRRKYDELNGAMKRSRSVLRQREPSNKRGSVCGQTSSENLNKIKRTLHQRKRERGRSKSRCEGKFKQGLENIFQSPQISSSTRSTYYYYIVLSRVEESQNWRNFRPKKIRSEDGLLGKIEMDSISRERYFLLTLMKSIGFPMPPKLLHRSSIFSRQRMSSKVCGKFSRNLNFFKFDRPKN